VLIDLDTAPPPVRPRGRRAAPALGVALFLMLALLLQGAAPPDRIGELAQVLDSGAMSSSALTPDALYLARPDGLIEAEPLAPGGPRWSVRVEAATPALALAGSVLIVRPGTFFLDARTGGELWRTPAPSVVHVFGDRVAYVDPAGLLRMADLATGHVRWQRQTSDRALDGDPGQRYVLGIDDADRATLYSAADGTVLTTGHDLGLDPYALGIGQAVGLSTDAFVGDVLYTHGQTAVAAYRLPGLAPMWRSKVVEPSVLGACGALICTTGDRGATALDPATGAVRWTSTRWGSIAPDGLAVANNQRVARIDPATGRVRDELGRGNLVGGLLLRYARDRTFVTGLADSRVYGVVPVIALADCATAGDFLACRTGDRSVTVWALE
jgi:outer membrane protein assembly factor BamB